MCKGHAETKLTRSSLAYRFQWKGPLNTTKSPLRPLRLAWRPILQSCQPNWCAESPGHESRCVYQIRKNESARAWVSFSPNKVAEEMRCGYSSGMTFSAEELVVESHASRVPTCSKRCTHRTLRGQIHRLWNTHSERQTGRKKNRWGQSSRQAFPPKPRSRSEVCGGAIRASKVAPFEELGPWPSIFKSLNRISIFGRNRNGDGEFVFWTSGDSTAAGAGPSPDEPGPHLPSEFPVGANAHLPGAPVCRESHFETQVPAEQRKGAYAVR